MFGAWCGLYYVIALTIGWWLLANWFPPIEPVLNAEEVAAMLNANLTKIRIGMVVMMFAAMLYLPFGAAITEQVAIVEGKFGIVSITCALSTFGNAMLTFYPPLWFLTAAFRPDRSAELIYLINDAAWLQLIGGLTVFLPICVAIALAALNDEREDPPFPRWSGFFNMWVFVLLLPGQLIFFFHTGPFAWNGLIAFWLAAVAFFGWFLVMFFLLRAYFKRQQAIA